MKEVNVPLLHQTLALVKAYPEKHDQSEWRCSTGMCFAGWAAMANGAEWTDPTDPWNPHVDDKRLDVVDEHVSYYAAKVLGLDHYDETVLFASSNTVEDLTRMVNNLTMGLDADGNPREDD